MTELEEAVYNNGERLVPHKSHNQQEYIRHRNSYEFFCQVIENDIRNRNINDKKLTEYDILDIGFGSGFGCHMLSDIENVYVTGIDNSKECKIYALQNYSDYKINYIVADAKEYVANMGEFDYIVSRGVLEHIPGGLDIINDLKFSKRVMIDVPYKEAAGNQFHVLLNITEDNFSKFSNYQLFYEDLNGKIYDIDHKPEKPNMIMLIISKPGLSRIII